MSKTFVGFLIASLLIWLLITLSKEYSTIITLPVSYGQLPQDKLLQKEPIKKLDFTVKGSGFKIILTKFGKDNIVLNTNNLFKKSNSKYYFLPNSQKINIQKQLRSGLVLEQVLIDTIYLNLGVLTTKKVPVKTNLSIKYHKGFDISEAIHVKPDSVIISGPEDQVDEIDFLNLTPLNLDDIKADFEETVSIIKPEDSQNIKLNIQSVKINGKVEKFTEGSLELPFEIKNLPIGIELSTFPKMVKVVYKIGLSNFNKIDANSFKVECDYKVSEANNYPYLVPNIISKSNLVKSVKLIPNKIDFLIQK